MYYTRIIADISSDTPPGLPGFITSKQVYTFVLIHNCTVGTNAIVYNKKASIILFINVYV